jgi:UDP-N-acetylmuramate--alanine ligase
MSEIDGSVLSYGIDNPEASVRAHQVKLDAFGSQCRVSIETDVVCEDIVLKLGVPGRHNVLNALAALTVGVWFGKDLSVVASALEDFLGVERRFEFLGEFGGVKVVDDYGHHPTEIVATLETARIGLSRRLIVVFQPHRFSRTRRLVSQFASALSLADELVLTDVFAASEPPITGASAESIMAAISEVSRIPMRKASSLDEAARTAIASASVGDVIVVLGAGSIGKIAPRIVAGLKELAP